jgi:hypothetical protein
MRREEQEVGPRWEANLQRALDGSIKGRYDAFVTMDKERTRSVKALARRQ